MKAWTLRAIKRGPRFGHQAMAGMGMGAKYDFLKQVSEIGADVPKAWAMYDRVILMDYIGNGAGPAPHVNGIDLNEKTSNRYFEQIRDSIVVMLSENLVHGDLSTHNIPVWKDRTWIIDLPQAIDVRFNRNAFELLRRNIESICSFFEQHGVQSNPMEIAIDRWERYQRAAL